MTSAIRKLLVANRSEIAIRVFRTAHELGIRTVAIYSHEDRYALHRFKADEAYQVGTRRRADPHVSGHRRHHRRRPPVRRRRDPSRLRLSVGEPGPGPGLPARPASSSAARRPRFWNNWATRSRPAASPRQAGVPILSGSSEPLDRSEAARKSWPRSSATRCCSRRPRGAAAAACAWSTRPKELAAALEQAQRESQAAFGSSDVFLEKYILRPRHIEVQLMGDKHGNLVHLYERDCSVQRRYQKVVEIAPALNLDPAAARRRSATRRCAIGRAVELRERRHGRVPGRRRHRQVLLHRGQSADPGRAHRDRGGHRRRHREVPDPGRRGTRRSPIRRSAWPRSTTCGRTAMPCNAA